MPRVRADDTQILLRANLDSMRREQLAFSTLFARLNPTRVPILILRMRGAEPALALVAENRGRLVAGLIQARNAFARGFCLLVA